VNVCRGSQTGVNSSTFTNCQTITACTASN
jgi:hypothetical protein